MSRREPMFQWNFENSRDRKKLFILLFILFSTSAVFIWWLSGNFDRGAAGGEPVKTAEEVSNPNQVVVFEENTPSEEESSSEGASLKQGVDEEKSKEVAKNFAKAFYEFDANDPTSHIEKSRDFMTETMYSREIRNQEKARNTLERVKAEVKETSLLESAHRADFGEVTWVVIIHGEVTDIEGNTKEDESWYHVALTFDEDQGWLVREVRINEST